MRKQPQQLVCGPGCLSLWMRPESNRNPIPIRQVMAEGVQATVAAHLVFEWPWARCQTIQWHRPAHGCRQRTSRHDSTLSDAPKFVAVCPKEKFLEHQPSFSAPLRGLWRQRCPWQLLYVWCLLVAQSRRDLFSVWEHVGRRHPLGPNIKGFDQFRRNQQPDQRLTFLGASSRRFELIEQGILQSWSSPFSRPGIQASDCDTISVAVVGWLILLFWYFTRRVEVRWLVSFCSVSRFPRSSFRFGISWLGSLLHLTIENLNFCDISLTDAMFFLDFFCARWIASYALAQHETDTLGSKIITGRIFFLEVISVTVCCPKRVIK